MPQGPPSTIEVVGQGLWTARPQHYLIRHSWVVSCYSAAIPSTFLQRPVQFVQAEDYDTCIAGPQREERLRRMEEQMQSIREFRGEGQTLWERPVSRSLGQRLLPNSDYQNSWIETMWLVIVMVWLHMKVVRLKRTSQVTVMPPHKVKHTTYCFASATFSICVWAIIGYQETLYTTGKLWRFDHLERVCHCMKGDNNSWGGRF